MPILKTPKKSSTVKKPKQSTKKVVQPQAAAPNHPRRLHLPAYRPLRLKRIKYPERLPSAWKITKKTCVLLWQRRWLFLGVAAVYGVLSLPFLNSIDIDSLKQQFGAGLGGGKAGQLITGLSVFTSLLTPSGSNTNMAGGSYQFFVVAVASLAAIWAIRQTASGQKVRIRDAFYKGMYPLVPFLLVFFVVLLQTVPFIIGAVLYTLVVSNGIAATGVEQLLWGLLLLVLTIISVYMLCSSLFALYVVTLPDMTPMKALRSARQLVRYRRGQVFPKLLYLPVVMLLVAAVIMVPVILLVAPAAQWVFFALSTFALIVLHAYMYTLYKELLA